MTRVCQTGPRTAQGPTNLRTRSLTQGSLLKEEKHIRYEKSCSRIERNQVVTFCHPASDHFCLGYVLTCAILPLEGCLLPSLFTHSSLLQIQLRWLFLDKTNQPCSLDICLRPAMLFNPDSNLPHPDHSVMIHTRDPDSSQALMTSRKKPFQPISLKMMLPISIKNCYNNNKNIVTAEILPCFASWQVSLPQVFWIVAKDTLTLGLQTHGIVNTLKLMFVLVPPIPQVP